MKNAAGPLVPERELWDHRIVRSCRTFSINRVAYCGYCAVPRAEQGLLLLGL